MRLYVILVSLMVISSVIESKPLHGANDFEVKNEIDYAKIGESKISSPDSQKKLSRQTELNTEQTLPNSIDQKIVNNDATIYESSSIKPQQQPDNILSSLLPLLRRWKFSPPTYLNDRLNLLKQSLENFGLINPSNNNNSTASKQFATANGLLHLVGLNDSGFYTDRFEPAGFLGGNGWFANKGGILGGPGAIISTGSLLTDYPTPYRR